MTLVSPPHRLVMDAISHDAWRICDTSAHMNDAAYVIAYVERAPEGYEVVWLRGAGRRRRRYPSLDDALEAAARIVDEGDSVGSRRPISIPSLRPRRG